MEDGAAGCTSAALSASALTSSTRALRTAAAVRRERDAIRNGAIGFLPRWHVPSSGAAPSSGSPLREESSGVSGATRAAATPLAWARVSVRPIRSRDPVTGETGPFASPSPERRPSVQAKPSSDTAAREVVARRAALSRAQGEVCSGGAV